MAYACATIIQFSGRWNENSSSASPKPHQKNARPRIADHLLSILYLFFTLLTFKAVSVSSQVSLHKKRRHRFFRPVMSSVYGTSTFVFMLPISLRCCRVLCIAKQAGIAPRLLLCSYYDITMKHDGVCRTRQYVQILHILNLRSALRHVCSLRFHFQLYFSRFGQR